MAPPRGTPSPRSSLRLTMAAVRGCGDVPAAAAVADLRAGGFSNRGGAALASDFAVDAVACAASASRA